MKLGLANSTHDPQLRRLVRSMAMPGAIRVAFAREPDFFRSLDIEGPFNQVIIASEHEKLYGMAVRSIKTVYVNGAEQDIGYLHGLRISDEARRSTLLGRGYRFLHRLHQDGRTPAYLTSIIESNKPVQKLLTSGRAGLPVYQDLGRVFTYAVNLNRRGRRKVDTGVTIRRDNESALSDISDFLQHEGRKQQFFPVYTVQELHSYTDFDPGHFYTLYDADGMAGVCGVWDQSAFKQNIITSYARWLATARPLINRGLQWSGYQPLPDAGNALRSFFISFVAVRDQDPALFRMLLNAVCQDYCTKNYHYFLVGCHETSPLVKTMSSFFTVRYTSRIYLVYWPDGQDFIRQIDPGLTPYLELATL